MDRSILILGTLVFPVLICLHFAVRRFTMTFHGVDKTPQGLYKTFAHLWVGLLLGLAIGTSNPGWMEIDPWIPAQFWFMAIGLTVVEVVAFFTRKPEKISPEEIKRQLEEYHRTTRQYLIFGGLTAKTLGRYAIHPGDSRFNDGELHRLEAPRLAELYGLKPGDYWVDWDTDSKGRSWDEFIHLYPRDDGDYTLPTE